MRVTSPSSIGHRHGGPLCPVLSEQKVDNVCRFVLLAQSCVHWPSLYCRLMMSIGVSAERAGDGLFMAFLMRAIIQARPGTRE